VGAWFSVFEKRGIIARVVNVLKKNNLSVGTSGELAERR
jgi:hypothetical protein